MSKVAFNHILVLMSRPPIYLILVSPVEGGHEGPVLLGVGQAQAVPELVGRRLEQVGPLKKNRIVIFQGVAGVWYPDQ